MSRIHGRRARLYVGLASDSASAEPVAFLTKVGFNFSSDKSDVTAFGDENKVYVAGLPDSAGTFAGFYDTATPQLYTAASDGLARKFYFYPDTTNAQYWFGTAFFDFEVETEVSGPAAISGSLAAASNVVKVG